MCRVRPSPGAFQPVSRRFRTPAEDDTNHPDTAAVDGAIDDEGEFNQPA